MVAFKSVQKLSAMLNSAMARSSFGIDAILRLPATIFFGLMAFNIVRGLVVFVLQWPTLDIPYKPLRLAADRGIFGFRGGHCQRRNRRQMGVEHRVDPDCGRSYCHQRFVGR